MKFAGFVLAFWVAVMVFAWAFMVSESRRESFYALAVAIYNTADSTSTVQEVKTKYSPAWIIKTGDSILKAKGR